MVHSLVLTGLGAVAVQTEGLVGHELLGAGVDGSTDSDAAGRSVSDGKFCEGGKGVGEEGSEEGNRSCSTRVM